MPKIFIDCESRSDTTITAKNNFLNNDIGSKKVYVHKLSDKPSFKILNFPSNYCGCIILLNISCIIIKKHGRKPSNIKKAMLSKELIIAYKLQYCKF